MGETFCLTIPTLGIESLLLDASLTCPICTLLSDCEAEFSFELCHTKTDYLKKKLILSYVTRKHVLLT